MDLPLEDVDFLHNQLTIALEFLISYEHMGVALVECVAGCHCNPREYSGWHPYKLSVTLWRVVKVTAPENSKVCTLRITIKDWFKSKPPEHEVKVNSVMISGEHDFIMSWLWCDKCIQ